MPSPFRNGRLQVAQKLPVPNAKRRWLKVNKIFELRLRGSMYKEISDELGIDIETVREVIEVEIQRLERENVSSDSETAE